MLSLTRASASQVEGRASGVIAMAVSETLALVDKVTAPATKMADAIGKVDVATRKARDGLALFMARDLRKHGKANENAAKRTAKGVESIGKAAKSAREPIKKLDGKDALGAFGVGGAIGSGIFTVAAGLTMVVDIIRNAISTAASLAVEFGKGVVEATLLRDKAQALGDTLSGGRGAQVLELIKQQAIRTGQSFTELQKATFDARDAGLSFKEAFKLNLVRADIIASGRSAKEADSAIGSMLSDVKSGSKSASKGLADLKEKFNVVGDGAKAAEKSTKTFAGAMTRLKEAGGLVFDKIAEKLKPTLDKAATKFLEWFDKFAEKGGSAEQVIDKIVGGIEKLIDITMIAATLILPFWEGLKAGLAPLGVMIDMVGEALGKAFGEDKASTMKTLEVVAYGLGAAIGVAVGAAVLFVGILGAIAATVVAPAILIGLLIAKLYELGSAGVTAGSNLISGLVSGITNGIGRAVQAAKDLANKVKDAVSSTLKMQSPSKVFADMGGNVAAGFAKGISGGASEVASAGRQLAVSPVGGAASGASGSAGGGNAVNLTINVSAQPGATKEDGERLALGLAPIIRREVASFFESAALQAGA